MAAKHLNELRAMKARKPFASFRIVTRTGENYRVDDRFQFAVTDRLVAYAIPTKDRMIEVMAEDIAAVELVEQKKPAA